MGTSSWSFICVMNLKYNPVQVHLKFFTNRYTYMSTEGYTSFPRKEAQLLRCSSYSSTLKMLEKNSS
jgi:hypothetical protein